MGGGGGGGVVTLATFLRCYLPLPSSGGGLPGGESLSLDTELTSSSLEEILSTPMDTKQRISNAINVMEFLFASIARSL